MLFKLDSEKHIFMKDKKDFMHFLNDKSFIEWRITLSEELEEYWQEYLLNHPEDEESINIAIEKCKSIRLNDRKLSDIQIETLWGTIVQDVESITNAARKRKRKKVALYLSTAASIAILIVSGIFINNRLSIQSDVVETIVGEKLPDEKIQLLAGNKVIDLNSDTHLIVDKNNKLLIEGDEDKTEEKLSGAGKMNKLLVPYGKRTTLTLSDGTKVWINSGSELEFPSKFGSDRREITVKGEIYIEVAENKSSPFFVRTSEFDVKVHGTKFNVLAYGDSSEKSVVLVDGKVEVNTGNTTPVFLSPNEKLAVNSGQVRKSVIDPMEYISWKDNILVLNRTAISDILKKIERYYNFSFETSGDIALYKKTCTGKLLLSEDIDNIMKSLSVLSSTTYRREDNKIYITTKN